MSPYREPAKREIISWLLPDTRRDRIILLCIALFFVLGGTVQAVRASQGDEPRGDGLTAEQVSAVVATNRVDLRERCFSPKRDIESARVTVDVVVGAGGAVLSTTSEGTHPAVSSCVENEMKRWRFPTRATPSRQPIRVPIVFQRT